MFFHFNLPSASEPDMMGDLESSGIMLWLALMTVSLLILVRGVLAGKKNL